MRASKTLLSAAMLVVLGPGAAAVAAKPGPPSPDASFVSTRTAVVVTELGAQEITVDTASTLTVTGRLVEGETLTYPLARLALAVEASGRSGTGAHRCNTVTTDQGRFSCTFHTAAHEVSGVAVRFAGNALFAPAEATTSIAAAPTATPPRTPVPTPTPAAATPSPTPAAATPPPAPAAATPSATPAAPTPSSSASPAAAPGPSVPPSEGATPTASAPAPARTPAPAPSTSSGVPGAPTP
ncbi:hypothetical protein [Streptomyces sp. NPDC088785]|uniref:hypothetical protein n=1 Tax=Streptomyces sp. NPDC088785 TaxID=3365897 RepID=UPI0038075D5E